MRWLWSLLIWFALTTAAIATTGLAADGPPEGSPELFGTAEPQVGDRGEYKAALVVVEGKEGHWTDMNAKFAFERLDDRWLLDADAVPHAVQSYLTEWRTEPFQFRPADWLTWEFPDCYDQLMAELPGSDGSFDSSDYDEDWGEAYGEAWAECADEIGDSADLYANHVAVQSYGGFMQAWEQPVHQVLASGWQITHHENGTGINRATTTQDVPLGLLDTWTTPQPSLGPCGFQHDLQGEPVDMWQPVHIQGGCPPFMEFGFAGLEPTGESATVRVSGTDQVGPWDTTVFSHVDDADLLRLWFTESVAYPVRIMSQVDAVPPEWVEYVNNGHPPEFYILLELVDYQAGDDVTDLGPAPQIPATAGTRQVWGPDDNGAPVSWELSDAFTEGRDAPNSELQDWLDDHPNAAVDSAHFTYVETPDGNREPTIDETWLFTVSDGDDTIQVVATRHTQTVVDETIPGFPTEVREPQSSFEQNNIPTGDRPGHAEQTRDMPTVRSLAARYEASMGQPAVGFGFLGCADPCTPRIFVGVLPHWGDGIPSVQAWSQGGQFVGQADAPGTYPSPTFSDPAWQPETANGAWGYHMAGAGVWHWPQPVTAATAVAVTGFASLLYFLWPLLKGAVPLFSRIKSEDLLEHPVREGLWDLVKDEPGIHFQEIVRRMEKGRGTLEHHLRKLVAAELLVEKSGKGFTCYFPKGQVDRRLMEAAPALKSAGARQVLQAVHAAPGASAQEIAERLGMAPSTINYHLKRLVTAHLVEPQRNGRRINLHPTALADQALGQFQT